MEHLKISEAQNIIFATIQRCYSETIALERSLGRVLAEDILANRDLPPYDVSAMDGFAVNSDDLLITPVALQIIDDIRAGDMPKVALQKGECARIMTGAPLPAGANAVIRVEDTLEVNTDTVQIIVTVKPGHDVRTCGENMRCGDVVLTAGTEITPGAIGILATVKAKQFQVYSQPRVAILSTGNELEALDDPVDLNKIPDANTHALMAQVQALGIQPVLLGIALDEPADLERHLLLGLEYDVLLVSGGTSVGVHDYVRPAIEKLNVAMQFWRVAMKPGHPMAFGVLRRLAGLKRDTFVFGLPGNPVSSMVCFEEFIAPAIRRMTGHSRLHRRTVTARLAHPIKTRPGRTEFVRVQLSNEREGFSASSTGTQSSGVLLSMAKADGLLVIPAQSGSLEKGAIVTVQLLDGTNFQHDRGFLE
jgi:molybdopterin molybdotransferase